MNTKNSGTNEPHRFKLDLTDKLNLKDPKKNMALANLSIYYTWKNIRSDLEWYFWFTRWILFYCRYSGLFWIYL